ncbi:MAG: GntR family transcriptional regulator [Fusobacteriaceae bacterium]
MKESKRNFKENTRDYVYRVIKENIMHLELEPGHNIGELELSELLGVSRTPVREAIVRLVNENLIDVYPQRGTYISKIDLTIVEEAFFLRDIIEKEVLKKAIKEFDESSLRLLEKNIYLQKGNTELGGETRERFDLDNEFHEIIYKKVGKARVWDAIKQISTHYDRLRFLDALDSSTLNKTLEQHQKIYEMIKIKDYSSLDSIVDEHLANYKDNMNYFKSKYPNFFI